MLRRQGVPLPDGTVAVAVPPPRTPTTTPQQVAQRRAQRVALHQQVWALRDHGWPGHALATQRDIGKRTVFRDLRTATWPERTRRRDRGRSVLNPYQPYLLERWHAGCRDAWRLCGERQRRGYPGSYATVARYAQRLGQAQGQAPRQRPPRQTLPGRGRALTATPHGPPGGLAGPATRGEARRGRGTAARPVARAACRSGRGDRTRPGLCPTRAPATTQQLEPWLAHAATSAVGAFQRFAKGLRDR
jgi:transposase